MPEVTLLLKTMFVFFYSRFMYPAIITIVISSLTFPLGLGQFMAAEVSIIDKIVIQYMLVYEIQENFDIKNIKRKFKIQNCIFFIN